LTKTILSAALSFDYEYGPMNMSNIDVRRIRNQKKSGDHVQVLCLFYHPSCVTRYRIYDRNQKLVLCPGPYEKFVIEGDKEEGMNKASVTGSNRDRSGSTGSVGSARMSTTPSRTVVQIEHQVRVDHRAWIQK